jgi:nitrogen fixation/metabolism regulation signal transduction histidine kinase
VLALLGLTIIPSVLVLLVGSRLLRDSTQRWFSAPVEAVVGSAKNIALELYREQEKQVAAHAARIAQGLPADAVAGSDLDAVRAALKTEVTQGRVTLVEVYRIQDGRTVPLVAVESPSMPRRDARVLLQACGAHRGRQHRQCRIRYARCRWETVRPCRDRARTGPLSAC